jgi:hypothetical protein
MCCEKVTHALDEIVLEEGSQMLKARGALFRLVTTCYGDCSLTVTEGLKKMVEEQKENPELLDKFFESLILGLRKDSFKNCAALGDVLHRLFLIKSYNTNKRLQLEAI